MKQLVLQGTQDHITPQAVTESATKLFPARSVAVVVRSGILEHTLPISLVPFQATANQDLKILTPGPDVDPKWLLYALVGHADDILRRCRKPGTTVASLNVPQLQEYELLVPPLAEQGRIADLLGAVQSLDWAYEEQVQRVRSLRRALAIEIKGRALASSAGESRPISDLVETSTGGLWGEEPGASELEVEVLRSTNFDNDGFLKNPEPVMRSVTQRQLSSRALRVGDILLEKSGGGPKQPVGRVVQVDEITEPAICANFVQLVRPDSTKVDPGWLFYLLWGSHADGDTLPFQNQTTGIRNLRTKDYLARRVNLPPRDDQERVVAQLGAASGALQSLGSAREGLVTLRSSLLAVLLSGEHEIPESYDRFLDGREDDIETTETLAA